MLSALSSDSISPLSCDTLYSLFDDKSIRGRVGVLSSDFDKVLCEHKTRPLSLKDRAYLYHYLILHDNPFNVSSMKRNFEVKDDDMAFFAKEYKKKYNSLSHDKYFSVATAISYYDYFIERYIARCAIKLEYYGEFLEDYFFTVYENTSRFILPIKLCIGILGLFFYVTKCFTYGHVTLQWLKIFLKPKHLRFLFNRFNDHVYMSVSFFSTLCYLTAWIMVQLNMLPLNTSWFLTVITFSPIAVLALDPRNIFLETKNRYFNRLNFFRNIVLLTLTILLIYKKFNLTSLANRIYREQCPSIVGQNTTDAYASDIYNSDNNRFRITHCYLAIRSVLGVDYDFSGVHGASTINECILWCLLTTSAAFFLCKLVSYFMREYPETMSERYYAEADLRKVVELNKHKTRKAPGSRQRFPVSFKPPLLPSKRMPGFFQLFFLLTNIMLIVIGMLGRRSRATILNDITSLYTVVFATQEQKELGAYTLSTQHALQNQESFAGPEYFLYQHPRMSDALIVLGVFFLLHCIGTVFCSMTQVKASDLYHAARDIRNTTSGDKKNHLSSHRRRYVSASNFTPNLQADPDFHVTMHDNLSVSRYPLVDVSSDVDADADTTATEDSHQQRIRKGYDTSSEVNMVDCFDSLPNSDFLAMPLEGEGATVGAYELKNYK